MTTTPNTGHGIIISPNFDEPMYILGFQNDAENMNEIIRNYERDEWGEPIEDENGHNCILGTGTILYARRSLQVSGSNLILWVDEDGKGKERPVNLKASWIHGNIVYGDALLYYEDRNNFANVIDMTSGDLDRFNAFCNDKTVEFSSGF